MEKRRLFTAIEITPSEALLSEIGHVNRLFAREEVAWTAIPNLHLTLFFLGGQFPSLLPAIIERLRQSLRHQQPFTINLHRVGTFGYSYRPKIIYVGVEQQMLHQMYEGIRQPLRDLGIEGQNPHFTPHITLGRLKSTFYIKEEMEQLQQFRFQRNIQQEVCSMHLYETLFTKRGVCYQKVETFHF